MRSASAHYVVWMATGAADAMCLSLALGYKEGWFGKVVKYSQT